MEENNITLTSYHIVNIIYGYEVKIVNVKLIPVKHLSMVNMMISNCIINDQLVKEVRVTENTIEKYKIDVDKTYVGSFVYNLPENAWIPTIINLKYDNGIPQEAGNIFCEELEKQVNEIHNAFVEKYGSNYMDNYLHKLEFYNSTYDLNPYQTHDFNIWKQHIATMRPTYMGGVILHKDAPYEILFQRLNVLSKSLFKPEEERPENGKELDTLYVESHDGITDFYDYGLDHMRYTDYELYDKSYPPYRTGIDIINFKQT